MATERLNVIALVSGGKDSFFSLLHCLANEHRIVALANLHPPDPTLPQQTSVTLSSTVVPESRQHGSSAGHDDRFHDSASGLPDSDEEADLNSFMYQTVGHQVIPLYAAATGLPLFRQPIIGTTVQSGISYRDPRHLSSAASSSTTHAAGQTVANKRDSGDGSQSGLVPALDQEDETESLVPLLRAVMKAHPEANALCTGAILSTYQRTRIESVALRLGLVPLAYLWQFPVLPIPDPVVPSSSPEIQPSLTYRGSHASGDDDAQLLRDMVIVGLEARIVKVASAGLDEDFLWENVASDKSIARVKRALSRFGGGGRGSVLGEGGEFETLVIDGPSALFKGRIVVGDADRRVVREGGGSTWLSIRGARVEMKEPSNESQGLTDVRVPSLLDTRFKEVLDDLQAGDYSSREPRSDAIPQLSCLAAEPSITTLQYEFTGSGKDWSVEEQTTRVVDEIRSLSELSVITNTVIVLRQMSDFPTINKIYGALFAEPNPPSRVTISCGDLLPAGSKIAVYISGQPGLSASSRQGLHVQSRSYWAPANIGPYSQAIVFPQGAKPQNGRVVDVSEAPKVVSIAGQIPLIPSSMELLQAPGSTPLQITLALQHLWRVGLEMQTQWWTSAVAYFPRTPAKEEMRQKALLASRAWQSAHDWSVGESDEDDENGPDLWDRKYNPQYMSLTGMDDSDTRPTLPAWDTLHCFDEDDDAEVRAQRPLPFVFSAEVEELPRASGVEWHAHRGLVKVSPGSIYVTNSEQHVTDLSAHLKLQHVVADSADEVYIHTIAAVALNDMGATVNIDAATTVVNEATVTSLKSALGSASLAVADLKPYLTYADGGIVSYSSSSTKGAIIPCHSLWSSQGQNFQLVMVYQIHFPKARKS